MARSMSTAVASAVWPSTSSVAGFTLSNRPPSAASTRAPSISSRDSPVSEVAGMRGLLFVRVSDVGMRTLGCVLLGWLGVLLG